MFCAVLQDDFRNKLRTAAGTAATDVDDADATFLMHICHKHD